MREGCVEGRAGEVGGKSVKKTGYLPSLGEGNPRPEGGEGGAGEKG